MTVLSATREIRSRIHHGLIPAVPVPFDADGRIDATAQERYAAYMVRQPVVGVAVWAHTGRGLHLRPDQRRQVLANWRNALGPAKAVVAGVGGSPHCAGDASAFVNSALDMAQDALTGGADALLVHPPTPFRRLPHNEDLVFEYHQRLASTGAPLILFYLYEAAGGIFYSPELLRQLLAMPEVVGVKLATLDSVMRFQDVVSQLATEFPDQLIITGEDRFLGYSLMSGAAAALIGMGAACTKLQHDLLESWFGGKGDEFLKFSRRVDRLAQVLFVSPIEGYIQRLLWALVHLGVLGREGAHDPWGPKLSETEFEAIGKTLRMLGELRD
jgi:4-hydroxy-tetrahydrodipicolinate synthase